MEMATELWIGTMKAIAEMPEVSSKERELATLCGELMEAGKDHPPIKSLLRLRAAMAEQGRPT